MNHSTIKTILPLIQKAKSNHQKIVLVTGVFDVIHQEHINFLNKAKSAGDFLIIGIETDKRVIKMKGDQRPNYPQQTRLENLQKLNLANAIFILPDKFSSSTDHQKLISQIKPNILAVSSHTKHQQKKKKIIEKYDGILKIVHQFNPQLSTTKILNNQH